MRTKILGLIGMIGAPSLFIIAFSSLEMHTIESRLLGLVLSSFHLLSWMCSIIGLKELSATGDHFLGKTLLVVQLIFLGLSNVFNICAFFDPEVNLIVSQVLDFFRPLSQFLMLIVGIAVLITYRIRGWASIVPLFVGLSLPLSWVIKSYYPQIPLQNLIISAYNMWTGLLLGYVVFKSKMWSFDMLSSGSSNAVDHDK